MTPLQRRLAAFGGGRVWLASVAALGAAEAGLLVAQAFALAHVVTGAFLGHAGLDELLWPLAGMAAAYAGRGIIAWIREVSGQARAAAARGRLRSDVCGAILRSPESFAEESRGEIATALTDGADALDAFYARYLPQLVLAAVVPVAVLTFVLPRDWTSALIMLVTLPLIPVFMALIGLASRASTERRWHALSRLGGHFLDVLGGLPTLRVLGRARAQETAIARVTDRYRAATMATLRVAFLSSMVLELAAAVSTALVAVAIGLRLDAGGMGLDAGLAVLVLTPEVYLPLRRLGAQFHASMDALAPAERLYELLDAAPRSGGTRVPDLRRDAIALTGLAVDRAGRGCVLEGVDLRIAPGDRIALVGESGAGKTTLLHVLLGFMAHSAGRVTVGGAPIEDIDVDRMRAQIGWVPQRPYLFAGTIADNVRFGAPGASSEAVAAALAAAGLGLAPDREIGEDGRALSAGQRQRLAIARALARNAPMLVLDEPTAHLDAGAQDELAGVLAALRGVTVVVAAHSRRIAAIADRVLELGRAPREQVA